MAAGSASGGAHADPPPTLIQFERPMQIDGPPAAVAESTGLPKRGGTAEAHVEEVINSVLPPRIWEQRDGTSWIQYTSKAPASRADVTTLQGTLDQRLLHRQARESGICPVREELYRQTLDEVIRQVALEGPERGLLLHRVRNEALMTLDAYRALFEASVVFGVRKQLQAEEGVPAMEEEAERLREQTTALEAQVLAQRNRLAVLERRHRERHELDERSRKQELDFLAHQHKHLDAFLRGMPGGGR
ncbi:hypothetical protein FNF27_00356 [Cafeteria roenbergensis]|uniref:Uncharacterized protein n=2 Tax=Cafeteria roenbergensis TaxID=33653 RepID=A0A5A8C3E6_CAFRO|nr:hypothetical protein FNF29_08092 [Cafeteria roenbergensis]KAA0168244.1 hypothetical protein FNF28_02539 [Cafeteria roenbergensis]KAA0178508.1 hypothetical protein FNF27_00356 [Cafeteria roenbergensis]|eukprot:KAA0146361.1 hypothetical protein FNF29_08092 [Cafeteria roenbergensis]